MFKAKLIENERYYKFRSRQLLLFFLTSILAGLAVSFYNISIWLIVVMAGIYILSIIIMFKNQKQVDLMLGNKLIEIDKDEIRIKSKEGIQQEVFKLVDIDELTLKENYSLPQETVKEMSGKAKRNYLILQYNGQERKLDFEIDSYFMINQLNKIIENWKTKGYNIKQMPSV